MKKFMVMLLCVCLVCGIDSSSIAANKKAKKTPAKKTDPITRLLKAGPLNAKYVNAGLIRSMLKKSGNDLILVIYGDADSEGISTTVNWMLVSAKTGSEKTGIIAHNDDAIYEELDPEVCQASFYMDGDNTLVFYNAEGAYYSKFTDQKGLAGLKRELKKSYKFSKDDYSDTAFLPLLFY